MPLTECTRCSEPIESPATLCTDCRVGVAKLAKAISQKHLTADTVDDQFCSDWLKCEMKRLFERTHALEHLAECANSFNQPHWFFDENWRAKTEVKRMYAAMARVQRVYSERIQTQEDTFAAKEAKRIEALERVAAAARKFFKEPHADWDDTAMRTKSVNEALAALDRVEGEGK